MINIIKKAVNIGLVGLTIFLIINNLSQCRKNGDNAVVIEELRAERLEEGKTFRLKEGELLTQVDAVRVANQALLDKMAEKELEIGKLKGKVKTLISVDRTFEISDTIHKVEIVEVELPGDTVVIDTCMRHIYPIYARTIKEVDGWYTLDLEIGKSLTLYELFIKDSFDVSLVHKNRFLKNDHIYVYTKSNNPYVKDQKVAAHVFEEKPARFGIGFSAGIGLTKNLELSPYVGLSANYNVITIK